MGGLPMGRFLQRTAEERSKEAIKNNTMRYFLSMWPANKGFF
jgi:hypothetical protein